MPSKQKRKTATKRATPATKKRTKARAKKRTNPRPSAHAQARRKQSAPPRQAVKQAKRRTQPKRVQVRPRRLANGRGRRRRNPGDVAELFEQFHGKPATRERDFDYAMSEPAEVAQLGRLLTLAVWLDEDRAVELSFHGSRVRLTCTGDGGQLYLVGGDQRLDLDELGLAGALPKDHVVIGQVQQIVYHTTKDFHDFEPVDYEHEFGEEGGELPTLCYDVAARRLYLVGGSYRVERPGIIN